MQNAEGILHPFCYNKKMSEIKNEALALKKYDRLANYFSVAQIFLRDNFFLDRKLKKEDIKKRLLGHWGTCPGISFVYGQTNRQILKNPELDFLYTVGPGHGFPAFQSGLFLEKSLSHFSPEKIPYSKKGAEEIIENFSTPYGYPSHLNPEAPGTIVEGGELGYSLSIAAGSVMDQKNLINVCLIGDGEAETGALSASWNFNKILSSKNDGAVLPVLHLNGYKISGPTFFGRMKDSEIKKYFEGLGFRVFFIDSEKKKNFYVRGIEIFDKALLQIKRVQKRAREEKSQLKPKWPIIILKTPKGMGAPEFFDDKKIVGNHTSHQIVFENVKENKEQLEALENWLKSYKAEELISFSDSGEIILDEDLKKVLPPEGKSIGTQKKSLGGEVKKDLILPGFERFFAPQKIAQNEGEDSMFLLGKYLAEVFEKNPENFRIFCPDETDSNHLTEIFKKTSRAWQMPIKGHDDRLATDGKVVEALSEHMLFGMLWGYVISGRFGFFVSYEAFAEIISSMADQYVKFIKISKRTNFRKPVSSLNIILSSLLERQDHNGFSHQNPSFIAGSLDRDLDIVNVYFPADKNLTLLAGEKVLKSENKLNVLVVGKKMKRIWLDEKQAKKQAEDEIMIWENFSDENPDLVMVSVGDYVTEESVVGLKLFRENFSEIKVRFVNIFRLNCLAENSTGGFSKEEILENFLTKEKGILFNFHGYSSTIKKLLFDYDLTKRIIINGYKEEGSTTSPFDMLARSGLSRFSFVENLSRLAKNQGLIPEEKYQEIAKKMQEKEEEIKKYNIEEKDDPDEIKNWEI